MSKLEELIHKLCPNGVQHHSLGELEDLGIVQLGRGNVISKNDMVKHPGSFPVYSSSATKNGMIGTYGKYMFDDERITWSIDGGGMFFYRNNEKYSVTNVGGWLKVKSELLITRFLFHTLSSQWQTKVFNYVDKAHPSVIRNEYQISVPPIEVQLEIVRILDNFTELTAELTAELSARKKQYQAYLDYLFENCKGEVKRLSEIGVLTRGKRFVHADSVETYGIPCIHYGELYTYYGVFADKNKSQIRRSILEEKNLRFANKSDVIIVGAGENNEDIGVGVAWEGDYPVAVHDACYTFVTKENPRFISFYLRSSSYHNQIKSYVSEGKICSISADGIGKAKLKVPKMEKQNQIVHTLERFYLLINNISEEIAARQKQYEYYRDKLLTFKELKV